MLKKEGYKYFTKKHFQEESKLKGFADNNKNTCD